MTTLMAPAPAPSSAALVDRPHRRRPVDLETVLELSAAALASLGLSWLSVSAAGIFNWFGAGVLTFLGFFPIYAVICWRRHGVLAMKDRLATASIWLGAAVAFVPLIWVIGYVIVQGGSLAFAHFPHFWTADMSNYSPILSPTTAGAGAAIVGTIEQMALATAFCVPLAVGTALYLVNKKNWFASTVGAVVDAMSGMPAIIPGLFIYQIWVKPQQHAGKSGFAASLALSLMMLPVVTRAAQEVISIVPGSLREAALALGSPEWRSTLRVTLPTARVGLVTGIILGIARIAGETAPILFVAGGLAAYNFNPFSGQQDNLPLRIYEMIFQSGISARRVAWGISFVLIVVLLLLFVAARLVGQRSPGSRRFLWRRRIHAAAD